MLLPCRPTELDVKPDSPLSRLSLSFEIAPLLRPHVSVIVSRLQVHRNDPVRPGREPAYAASSQHESSEEEKGEDQSELLNDYVDDLYFVLGLLPQDRLAPFINQMRRVARALCSRAFRVWIHHVQRQSKTVEFCGTCLKTSLENSFFQVL